MDSSDSSNSSDSSDSSDSSSEDERTKPQITFTDDDEEEDDDSSGNEQTLSWRLDPEESFSDWTIIINDTTYHVHKIFLGAGPRKSEYFSRLFRLGGCQLAESATSTSNIELKESAVEAFPVMLDFMYFNKQCLDIGNGLKSNYKRKMAVALRYLATYFDIEKLRKRSYKCIKDDLEFRNAHLYLMEAALYNDEKIMKVSTILCSSNIRYILEAETKDIHEFMNMPVKNFQRIFCCPNLECDGETLSRLVTDFYLCQPNAMDKQILQNLTSPDKMPSIAKDVALFLLEMDIKYSVTVRIEGEEHDDSSLQKRCIDAASRNWKYFLEQPEEVSYCHPKCLFERNLVNVWVNYKKFPAEIQIELLESSLRYTHSCLVNQKEPEKKQRKNKRIRNRK